MIAGIDTVSPPVPESTTIESSVIPAPTIVIPAKAGIHLHTALTTIEAIVIPDGMLFEIREARTD